jgi:hypothetical protein
MTDGEAVIPGREANYGAQLRTWESPDFLGRKGAP